MSIQDVLANRAAWAVECADVRAGLRALPAESVHCVVTSPPYWGLRDYGTAQWEGGDAECDHRNNVAPRSTRPPGEFHGGDDRFIETPFKDTCGKCGARRVDNQLGLEASPEEFVANMVSVFREVWRVLRKDATCWLNIGDCYNSSPSNQLNTRDWGDGYQRRGNGEKRQRRDLAGLPPKSLMMMPARLALALQADGWLLRSEITWCKRAPMPESCTDRPTSATEKIYLLTKGERYFYDQDAIREPAATTPEQAATKWAAMRNGTEKGQLAGIYHGGGQPFRSDPNPAGRNSWNYWVLSPESFAQAHFATFPTEIPRRAILAGTSQHGCCARCGAGWRRVVERERGSAGESMDRPKGLGAAAAGQRGHGTATSTLSISGRDGGWAARGSKNTTTGWAPSCRCGVDEVVPALVLDPFSGAGTTGLVARRLGRRYVGLELSPEYVAMSEDRIRGDNPMQEHIEEVRREEALQLVMEWGA